MLPLEGILVVELSMIVSGSSCGKVLREYGAEVIKIETGEGDNYRRFGTIFNAPIEPEENIVFETVNSGKKFVKMDLRDPEDMRRLHELLSRADVFVTNYRPKALRAMHMDYPSLKEKYPRLIYAAITGYGETGPKTSRPGFDTVSFWAEGGFLRDMMIDAPGNFPVYVPIGVGDSVVGTELAGAIGTALYQREKTGLGTSVTTSLYGTAIWTFSSLSSGTQYGYKWPRGRYEGSPGGTPYLTRDKKWVLTTLEKYNQLWPGFCRAFHAEELIDNPRFNDRDAATILENRRDAILALEAHAAELDAEEICKVLDAEDIVYTVLGHFSGNHQSEQAMVNQYVIPYTYESGKSVTIAKPPIRFGDSEPLPHSTTGDVGRDTELVYQEFNIQ